MKSWLTWAAMAALTSLPASAASGVISGRFMFYQNQGNYCPDTRDCSGAQYLESEYQTYQPVGDALVFLRDQNNVIIGQGSTGPDGRFTVAWSRTPAPSFGVAYWTLRHKDGRFQIRAPGGGTYAYWTPNLTLTSGTTASSPQDVGTWYTGSSGAPSDLANAYDGAKKMWTNALSKSARMLNTFTNLDVRAFSSTQPRDCPTSCANGDDNRVQLDTNAAYSPQGRILHEMGHIASYKSNPRSQPSNYCYPDSTCSSGSWSWTTAEWKQASFEEGMATFFGDTALYYWWAKDPRTCLSSGTCSGTNSQIETSNGNPNANTCSSSEWRAALSVDRYFWDIYDDQDDPNWTDDLRRERYEVFDTLATFPSGFGDHQNNEPYNSSWQVDALDGFSGWDFYYNYSVNHPSHTHSFLALWNNCYPN